MSEEFESFKAKINAFKIELKYLLRKHSITIEEQSNYGVIEDDEYQGETYYFKIGEKVWIEDPVIETLIEMTKDK